MLKGGRRNSGRGKMQRIGGEKRNKTRNRQNRWKREKRETRENREKRVDIEKSKTGSTNPDFLKVFAHFRAQLILSTFVIERLARSEQALDEVMFHEVSL